MDKCNDYSFPHVISSSRNLRRPQEDRCLSDIAFSGGARFLSGLATSDPRDPLLREARRVPNANQIYIQSATFLSGEREGSIPNHVFWIYDLVELFGFNQSGFDRRLAQSSAIVVRSVCNLRGIVVANYRAQGRDQH